MGVEKFKRPLQQHSEKFELTTVSTVGSTIKPWGYTEINSTSTGAPFTATLGAPLAIGQRVTILARAVASTSDAPLHVNMPSSDITVDGTTADMLVLSSQGAAATLISLSSSRWLVESSINATYSTST